MEQAIGSTYPGGNYVYADYDKQESETIPIPTRSLCLFSDGPSTPGFETPQDWAAIHAISEPIIARKNTIFPKDLLALTDNDMIVTAHGMAATAELAAWDAATPQDTGVQTAFNRSIPMLALAVNTDAVEPEYETGYSTKTTHALVLKNAAKTAAFLQPALTKYFINLADQSANN